MHYRRILFAVLFSFVAFLSAWGQEVAEPTTGVGATDTSMTTAAAAAVASGHADVRTPDFLEHLVDLVLALFDIRSSGNTATHYTIALLITLIAYVLRRVVTTLLFHGFKRIAARTATTLDDKLFPALEGPVNALIIVVGTVASIKVLKLSETADQTLSYAYTMAFSFVIFWGFLRTFNTILDHMQEVAKKKQLSLAPFMPWIKKALITIVFIFGVLMIAQSLGADVKAFLAGLGIGGLAFALAAQDTIANIFGSVVVAVDQPFKIGETVRIGSTTGTVEDMGLRSTKIRALDRSLVVIPNKAVASETITNLSRFNGRRIEQTLGLTYDTTADQMQELVGEFRRLITEDSDVDPTTIHCYFRDYNNSSLDIWIVYVAKDPDFQKQLVLRQRLNLAFMRAVEQRGLSFAFPTQTVHVASLPKGQAKE
ncbi:MAG: mechanosensitive ion channel family protein [Candidatus Didemnitutus sp.]|nr:mechanosensitive ion channel family protein [Candidatus Didemnitutus sp.]